MAFFESSSRSIFLFEHDLFGKPAPTFADHAPATPDFGILRDKYASTTRPVRCPLGEFAPFEYFAACPLTEGFETNSGRPTMSGASCEI
jgi:hypothetical protein